MQECCTFLCEHLPITRLFMLLQDPALEEGLEEAEQRMQPGSIKHALFHVSKLELIRIQIINK